MAAGRGVYVTHLIPGLQDAGFSASGALEYLKGNLDRLSAADRAAAERYSGPGVAGEGGMRRQNFLRAWGGMQADAALREGASTGDPYGVPHVTEITRMARPRARGFEYVVNLPVYDVQAKAFHFSPMSIVTDKLITTLEAKERAAQTLQSIYNSSDEKYEHLQVFGFGDLAHVFERVPEIDEPLE